MAFAPYEDAWDGMGRRIARDREPSRASLPPRLSSEEVEQLCTHSPADQS